MSTLCQLDQNNYFIGVAVTDVDPLDPTNTLIPAGVVDAPLPSPQEGYLAKWDGAWVYEKNGAAAKTLPKPPLSATQVADLNAETTLLDGSWVYAWTVRDKTQAERDAELTQWRSTALLYRRDFCIALKRASILPTQEAISAAKGDWPATFATALAGLSQDEQDEAQIEWAAVIEIRRNHPMIALLGVAAGMTEGQVDALFGWTA